MCPGRLAWSRTPPFQGGDHGIEAHPGYQNLGTRKGLWLIPKAFFTLLSAVSRVTASSHQVLQAPDVKDNHTEVES